MWKKEELFIGNRLLQIDIAIMEAFTTKKIDSNEIAPTFILENSFYALGFLQA